MATLAVAALTLFLVGLACTESVPHLEFISEVKQADADVRKAVNAVANDIKTQARISQNHQLNPIRYISQPLAETNYINIVEIQAYVGRETAKVFHASISGDLRGTVFTLNGVQPASTGATLRRF